MDVIGMYNYWVVVVLMMAGLYILIARYNLIKKMIGLSIFQTSIFYLYITMGKVAGGTAPILVDDPNVVYSNRDNGGGLGAGGTHLRGLRNHRRG